MNINFGFRLLKKAFICLSLISVVTACESIQAQEIRLQPQQVAYGDSNGKLSDQGFSRTYYIYTPKSYSAKSPMPLVLVFHGDDGSGHSISNVTQFNKLAEEKGFIVVYPDAIDHKWSLRKKSPNKVDDIAFLNKLIDHLQQVRNIDSSRIYATGFSKGGILTQALTCELSDRIAAFASVAGSLPLRLKDTCKPSMPVSMLMINGTNDQSVHYQGDDKSQKGALISIPETVNFWRENNQCADNNTELIVNKPSSNPNLKAYSYSNCTGGSEVQQLAVVNGGHIWYGGSSSDKTVNKFNKNLGLDSSQAIWDFFARHSLPSI